MPRPEKYHIPLKSMRRRILDGTFSPGERLPTEQQLCKEFALSRSCIRKALTILQEENLVVTEAGNGHFASGATQRKQRCQDTALIMPVNFAQWSIQNNRCMLYTLLEQHVVQHTGTFTHVQLSERETSERLVKQVEESGATWVIVDLEATSLLRSYGLLWHLLENLECRVVVTGFVGSSYTTSFDQVGTDWAGGTRSAVNHLLGLGHKRLIYAGYDGVDWSDDRRSAFLAALRPAGMWPDGAPAPCIPYPGEVEFKRPGLPVSTISATAASNLLEVIRKDPVDAIVCANDALAMELANLAPLHELPTLVGFDNTPWSKENGVSSVSMDLRRHADKVFELLAGPPSPDTRLVRIPTLLATR